MEIEKNTGISIQRMIYLQLISQICKLYKMQKWAMMSVTLIHPVIHIAD